MRRSSTRRALRYKVSRPTRTCPRAHVLPYSPLLCPSLHRHLPDRRGRCVNLLLGLHRRALSPLPAGAAAAPAPHSPVTYRVARPVLVARGSLPRVVECAWWMTHGRSPCRGGRSSLWLRAAAPRATPPSPLHPAAQHRRVPCTVPLSSHEVACCGRVCAARSVAARPCLVVTSCVSVPRRCVHAHHGLNVDASTCRTTIK